MARYREQVARSEGEKRLDRDSAGKPGSGGTSAAIGSRRARIVAARVLDGAGHPAGRLRSGEAATLEMDVRAQAELTDFVFGFAIATVSGSPVFGSNTAIDGLAAGALSGDAKVRLEIPAMTLAPGVYAVDAAVHAADGAPYDYRRDVLRFEVTSEAAAAGVWSPPLRWKFEGAVRWKP